MSQLASKLAAQNAGGIGAGAMQQQVGVYSSGQQQQGAYPPPPQQQSVVNASSNQQQGFYPPPPQQPLPQQATSLTQHQAAGSQSQPAQPQLPSAQQISFYKQLLQGTIQEKQLQYFFSQTDSRLDQAATVAATHIDQVCARWRLPREVGQDLAKLALFDIILYINNSGSMQFEEDGERIHDLRQVLAHVVDVVSLFDSDGFTLRFMNGPKGERELENIKDLATIDRYLSRPGIFHSTTPLGSELKKQILNDIVAKAQSLTLPKPVLVITITDGIPVGESKNTLRDAIYHASRGVAATNCGPGAISFQFAQVGNDKNAQEYLSKLDNDPEIGHLIDCTSNYEQESEQMMKANPSVDLTPQLWLLKMLVGAIDSSYDEKDEIGSRPGGQAGGGPPPQYSTHSQHSTKGTYDQPDNLQQRAHLPSSHQAYRLAPAEPNGQQAYGQAPPQPYYGQPGSGQPQLARQGYNAPYSYS